MLILKYLNNSETSYEVNFSQIKDNIIEIQGDFPVETSGFILSRPDHDDDWDYSAFKTIYRTLESAVQFSNNGTIYAASESMIRTPDFVYKPYVPTPEEIEQQFQRNKAQKIMLSKTMLSEFLNDNPIHSTAHNNTEGIYSVTNEKQTLMMNRYMMYQVEKSINPDAKLTWNESGKSWEEWREAEFLQLILEIKAYIHPLVFYQQKIEEEILYCNTQEELDEIVIDYAFVAYMK